MRMQRKPPVSAAPAERYIGATVPGHRLESEADPTYCCDLSEVVTELIGRLRRLEVQVAELSALRKGAAR